MGEALNKFVEEARHLSETFDSHTVFSIGGWDISQYTLYMFFILALVLMVVLIGGRKLQLVPKNKFLNTVEYGYDFVNTSIGQDVIGEGELLGRPYQLGIHERGAYGICRRPVINGDGGLLTLSQKVDLRRHAAGNRGADEPQDADAKKGQHDKEHIMRHIGAFRLDIAGIVRAEHTVAARVRRACRMGWAAGISHLPTRGHLLYLSPAWRASSHA